MELEALGHINRGIGNCIEKGQVFTEPNEDVANRLIYIGSAKKYVKETSFLKKIFKGVDSVEIPESRIDNLINIRMEDGSVRKARLVLVKLESKKASTKIKPKNSEKDKSDKRLDDIVTIIKMFDDTPEYFTTEGLPRVEKIEDILKSQITMSERNEAMDIIKKDSGG